MSKKVQALDIGYGYVKQYDGESPPRMFPTAAVPKPAGGLRMAGIVGSETDPEIQSHCLGVCLTCT
jgi:hypothetical protein